MVLFTVIYFENPIQDKMIGSRLLSSNVGYWILKLAITCLYQVQHLSFDQSEN